MEEVEGSSDRTDPLVAPLDHHDENSLENDTNGESLAASPNTPALGWVQFFRAFLRTRGTKAIVLITLFYALGVGCVIGVVSTKRQIASRPLCSLFSTSFDDSLTPTALIQSPRFRNKWRIDMPD